MFSSTAARRIINRLRAKLLVELPSELSVFSHAVSIYLDATRSWLLRVVAEPLRGFINSDIHAQVDFTRSTSLGCVAKLLPCMFDKKRYRCSTHDTLLRRWCLLHAWCVTQTITLGLQRSLSWTLLRLHVRVKGIITALFRAGTHIPGPLLRFLRLLASDGGCLPHSYWFWCERQVLRFSETGLTRRMRYS